MKLILFILLQVVLPQISPPTHQTPDGLYEIGATFDDVSKRKIKRVYRAPSSNYGQLQKIYGTPNSSYKLSEIWESLTEEQRQEFIEEYQAYINGEIGINTGWGQWFYRYFKFFGSGSNQRPEEKPWETPLPLETDGESVRYLLFLSLIFLIYKKRLAEP